MSATEPNVPATRARNQAVLFGALSLLVASATAVTAWWVVSEYERELAVVQDGSAQGLVVVAARELREGTVITSEDLSFASAPAGTPISSLFTSTDGLVGKAVGDTVLAGEAIRLERLTIGGSHLRLDEVIDPGTRAVTIRTNHASAVGGLLRPGFYVDIIVTIRPDNRELSADWVTETVLQGVRVIAVNDSVSTTPVLVEGQEGRQDARDIFVTLEVQPAEAEELALSSTRGQIHLALRATDDFEILEAGTPLVTNALLGIPPRVAEAQKERIERKRTVARIAAPPPPADAPPQRIEVIRGGKVTTEQFNEQGEHLAPAKGR